MKKITRALIESSRSLTDRLTTLHTKLIETVPGVDRIACALYDSQEDTLKTFINSTHNGNTLVGYEYPLSDSYLLAPKPN